MAKLTEEQKRFIVEQLACFERPVDVQAMLREEFGLENVPKQQVHQFDPTRCPNRERAKKWDTLFHETRKRYLEEVGKIPIAQKGFRLQQLQQLFFKARTSGNIVLAADLLERAAKEVGEAYTNRRVFSPEDPAEALARELGLPVEEIRAMAAALAAGDGVQSGGTDGDGDG